MSEHGVVMEENKMSKASSVQGHESAWLGRWTQLGNEVKFHDQSKDLIKPEDKRSDQGVLPFPMFKVSQKRYNSTKDDVGSSSKAVVANRMPWMNAQGDKEKFSSSDHLDFPVQEKTTQNLLELMRPVRFYATVDSVQRVSLPEEDSQQLLKGSKVSMKLKGKIFGGYLDLFPSADHQHRGGVRLQSLESSKDTEEDGPRQNESSAETDILEMDKLHQTIHISGSISSSSTKGKGKRGDSAIPRTEIPDMNEEPPLVLDGEGETSNSATQSMNVDHFLSRDCKRTRLEPDVEPSSRWVKRLKTTATASDSSGHGETKSLMKNEVASRDKKGNNNNNLFLEILKSGINNLQPRNQEPFTQEIKKLNQGGEDVTLQHPWIQRWCKKKATLADQPEVQEPENQKELEKKQYPSIAAMALMGKALSGLNPYGLKKTDSLMVWNARDLR
ncbi:F-box protein [Hirschfeldia incana]|nr:F-box protein [Hirschfeldia incana]